MYSKKRTDYITSLGNQQRHGSSEPRLMRASGTVLLGALDLVMGKFGSDFGSNLNRTELNAKFRFKVQWLSEPERIVQFSARGERSPDLVN